MIVGMFPLHLRQFPTLLELLQGIRAKRLQEKKTGRCWFFFVIGKKTPGNEALIHQIFQASEEILSSFPLGGHQSLESFFHKSISKNTQAHKYLPFPGR